MSIPRRRGGDVIKIVTFGNLTIGLSFLTLLLIGGFISVIGDIRQSASNLISFFEQNKKTEIYRFHRSFSYPEGCCESVSLIFNYLLNAKYPSAKAQIVRGTNTKYEHHFWLEVETLIFDLTAHQFKDIEAPILGEKLSPLTKEYEHDGEEPGYDLVDEGTIIMLHQRDVFGF